VRGARLKVANGRRGRSRLHGVRVGTRAAREARSSARPYLKQAGPVEDRRRAAADEQSVLVAPEVSDLGVVAETERA
jgi:hypothetical protein